MSPASSSTQSHSTNRTLKFFAFTIFALLCIRAIFLGPIDLLDPTEGRYAAVALEMVNSSNWMIPSLPGPDGAVPYLGKPPMHFWLTALSYKFFGVDEWTSRLSSFVAAIGTLALLFWFGRSVRSNTMGALAAFLTISTIEFFLLSGASIIDVTLTFWTCATAIFGYCSIVKTKMNQNLARAIFPLMLAGGFLTKGPIAWVLPGPALAYAWWTASTPRQAFSWKWISYAGIATVLLVAPWFIIAENLYPGSAKYFFWNENIARYLFKEYGDRYGSGHRYPYGTALGMGLISFIPWTPWLAVLLWKMGRRRLFENQLIIFSLIWGMTPLMFFSLARQLHFGYVLPGMPGLGFAMALLLIESPVAGMSGRLRRRLSWGCVTVAVAYTGVGLYLTKFSHDNSSRLPMEYVSNHLRGEQINIGFFDRNIFEPMWLGSAGVRELSDNITVHLFERSDCLNLSPEFLIEEKRIRSLPECFRKQYVDMADLGRWHWFSSTAGAIPITAPTIEKLPASLLSLQR